MARAELLPARRDRLATERSTSVHSEASRLGLSSQPHCGGWYEKQPSDGVAAPKQPDHHDHHSRRVDETQGQHHVRIISPRGAVVKTVPTRPRACALLPPFDELRSAASSHLPGQTMLIAQSGPTHAALAGTLPRRRQLDGAPASRDRASARSGLAANNASPAIRGDCESSAARGAQLNTTAATAMRQTGHLAPQPAQSRNAREGATAAWRAGEAVPPRAELESRPW